MAYIKDISDFNKRLTSLENQTLAFKSGRVDVPLTNISLDYRPEGFIADMVLTELNVPEYSGILAGYGKSHLQLVQNRVLDRGKYLLIPTVEYNLQNTYFLEGHGFADRISKRDRKEIKAPFNVESDKTEGLKSIYMIEKEYGVATMMRRTATYPSGHSEALSGNARWNQYTSTTSNPLDKIKDAKTKIWRATGVRATTMILSLDVLDILLAHPRLTNYYGSTGAYNVLSVDQLKKIFGLREVIVASAHYDVNDVSTPFWGTDVIITNRAMKASRHQRTLGYCIKMDGEEEKMYRSPIYNPPGTEQLIIEGFYQYAVFNQACGYIFKTVID